jgi:hypothetical protein
MLGIGLDPLIDDAGERHRSSGLLLAPVVQFPTCVGAGCDAAADLGANIL